MAFGEYTKVPVDRTMSEIVKLIKKTGAERIGQFEEPNRLSIQFFSSDRMVRFTLTIPENANEQRRKQRARALLLVIKAKLESVESGVETFEEAFLANVVMPDGRTVAEQALPVISQAYSDGRQPAFLLPPPEPR